MSKDERFEQWYAEIQKVEDQPFRWIRKGVIEAMRLAWQAGYDAHIQEIKDFIAGKLQGEDEHGKSE